MKLTLGEAAALLNSEEDRVHHWIESADLPAQKIRGEYWINRTELLEWATEHDVGVAPRAFRGDHATPSLAAALRAGGVHDNVPGSDLDSVLRYVVGHLSLADHSDRETLLDVLLGRGALGLKGVGDGIAVPQVRTPIVLAPRVAMLSLWYLQPPLDYSAFFLLVSPTVHVHLAMLAKLTFALKRGEFRGAVRGRRPEDDLVRLAARMEDEL
ncbi:MAG TPA: helix-turn-helix domain-containing protein [Thermoanaerobaculia bacterium]|nr:helix-turn-helix domain-containing protein [Thermoanaerobaculia bacterium]